MSAQTAPKSDVLRNTVEMLSDQVSSEAEVQDVLDVGNALLKTAEDECTVLNFQRRIAESMLSKVTATQTGSDTASVALRGEVVCGVGARSCSNCDLSVVAEN